MGDAGGKEDWDAEMVLRSKVRMDVPGMVARIYIPAAQFSLNP